MKQTWFFLGVILVGGCGPDPSSEELRRCRAQAEEMGKALVARDYEKFAGLAYPKLVEALGGRDQMIALARARAKKDAFEIVALQVAAPERIIVAGSDIFAVVPVEGFFARHAAAS